MENNRGNFKVKKVIKIILRILLGLIISGILLYLIFKRIEISKVIAVMKTAEWGYVVLSILVIPLLIFVRSYRWKMLAEEYRGHKIMKFFKATNIGLMMNILLPFRIGDFVQAYTLNQDTNVGKSKTFSTVVTERFVDLCFPISVLIFSSFFIMLPKEVGLERIVLLVLFVFLFLVLFFKSRPIAKFLFNEKKIIGKLSDKIYNLFDNFHSTLLGLSRPGLLIKIISLTVFLWTGYTFTLLLCLWAFHINFSLFICYFVQSLIALSVIIPSSPGYFGTWEFFTVLALSIFKVEYNKSVGFAFVYHFVHLLPYLFLGSIFLINNLFRSLRKNKM